MSCDAAHTGDLHEGAGLWIAFGHELRDPAIVGADLLSHPLEHVEEWIEGSL
jgi:hypothetical protein